MMRVFSVAALALLQAVLSALSVGQSTDKPLDDRVADIFERSCTLVGCHSGPQPMQSLDLTRDQFRASTIGVESTEVPGRLLVHPGNPDSSYLMMKVRGSEEIFGLPMPFTGERLTSEEIETLESWIEGLDAGDAEEAVASGPVYPFPGWKVINLPTARALPTRTLLFLISHRFVPEVTTGYDTFLGLDGQGIIYLSLGYALSEKMLLAIGRSNELDDVEAQLRYQFLRQGSGSPLGVALQAHTNVLTEDRPSITGRTKIGLQASFTRLLRDRVSLALVPGVLTNPAEEIEEEDLLFTLGLGGRWQVGAQTSLVVEWIPMVSGYSRTRTVGRTNRYDTFGAGLEIATAGHVFQIVLTNALGLATDQYLRGGDLDVLSGDVRLGFNIFRMIGL